IDIIYTNVLGVYMFTYPVAIYIVHMLKNVFHTNVYSTIFMSAIGILVVEIIINFIYLTIDISNMSWIVFTFYRLIPTLIANIVLLLILYLFTKNLLIRLSERDH